MPNLVRDNRRLILPRLCGRQAEEQQFYRFFTRELEKQPGRPQICLLNSAANQRHEGFAERLAEVGIREEAQLRWGETDGTVLLSAVVEWPFGDGLAERQEALSRRLFASFNAPADGELTADALRRSLKTRKIRVAVARHRLETARWDSPAGRLLDWYAAFWHGLRDDPNGPQFVVFLDFLTPAKPSGCVLSRRFKQWQAARAQSRLARHLNAVTIPRLTLPFWSLPALSAPTREDVAAWLRRYTNFDERAVNDWLEQIFAAPLQRPDAAAIEDKLGEINPHNLKEGVIDDVRKWFRAVRRDWQHAGRT
jgi:hypothetical protein